MTVSVVCADGSEGKREVWAHKLPDSDKQALVDASQHLRGGDGKEFTPAAVQGAYSRFAGYGDLYTLPMKSADGLQVAAGAQTPLPNVQAWRSDIWAAIKSGNTNQVIGSAGFTVNTMVGHEGVHLLQWAGSGVGLGATGQQMENEAYSIKWSYR